MLKVRDIMNGNFFSIPSHTPVIEVANQMREERVTAIPVCDGGKFQGIVTIEDFVDFVANGIDPVIAPVISIINDHCPVISPGITIVQALEMMTENHTHVLVVMRNGKMQGFLTLEDIVQKSQPLLGMVFGKTSKTGTQANKKQAGKQL